MMMSILEEKIRKNRKQYDVHEPGEGHVERFTRKLDEEFHADKPHSRRLIWRVAAAILVLVSVSGMLLYQYTGNSSSAMAGAVNDELSLVADHYDRLAAQKLDDINNCAGSDEEAAKIDSMAKAQLDQLEKDASLLKEELDRDESNDRVYGALVTNYRTRIKILDNIITKICQL